MKSYFRTWHAYALIVIAGFLLYVRSLWFDLVYLDDNVWVQDYAWFLSNPRNVSHFFTHPDFISNVFYRPVLNLSFMLNAILSGETPFSYRLFNLSLHLINGCIVFHILRRLGYSNRLSLTASLVFEVNPVLTNAIVWIPGRTDSLLGFFVFLGFLCSLNFVQLRGRRYLILYLCMLALGLLTKETAIIMPLAALSYLLLFRRDLCKTKYFFISLMSSAVVIGGWLIIRQSILAGSPSVPFRTVVSSIIENLSALITYFGKIILPVNLSVVPIPEDISIWPGVFSVIAVGISLWFSRSRRWNYVIFGLLWYLFFILPPLIISFIEHEYRVYIPIVGVLIMLMEIDWVKKFDDNSRRWITATTAMVIALAAMTVMYSRFFKDRYAFWNNAVAHSPHLPLAHRNLAAMYQMDGEFDKAEPEYWRALELNWQEAMVYNNLGLIYQRRGDQKKAEEFYLQEIRINPKYDNVYFNLGILYYQQGKKDAAAELWKKTLELNPEFLNACRNMLVYVYEKNDLEGMRYYAGQLRQRGIPLPPSVERVLQNNP